MPVGGASGGNRAGDVRAGGAYVEVSLRDRLSQALANVKKRFESFAKTSAKIGLGAFGAGAGGAAAIGKLFGEAVERGAEFQTLAEKFGTTTETVSKLAYAFEAAGVPVEQFGDSIKGLEKKLSMAADGQDETFRRLGLNARELMRLPLDEQFAAIADAITRVESPADQARIAMELFEESGLKLLPTLKKGRAGLAEMGDEAKKVGAILDSDTAKKSQEVSRAFTRSWSSIKYAALEIGTALLDNTDTIKEIAGAVVNIARTVRGWISENKQLVSIIAAVTIGVAVAGAGLIAMGLAASAAAAAISAATTIVGGLAAGFTLLLSPIGLVTAAVVALVAMWATQTDEGTAFVSRLGREIGHVAETVKNMWGGVTAALSQGDLKTAGKIATLGLELAFVRAQGRILENWNDFKGLFVDGFYDAIKLIKLAWNDLDNWFTDAFLDVVKSLNESFGGGIKKMLLGLAATLEQNDPLGIFGDAVNDLKMLGNAFGSSGFGDALDQAKKDNAADHLSEANRIHNEAFDAQAARTKARADDLKEVDGLAERIAKELDDLIGEAKANAKPSLGKAGLDSIAGAGNLLKQLPSLASLTNAVKGGFATPFLARQFGGGDTVAKRQLAAAEKAAKVQAEELPAINQGVKDIAVGLRFAP